MQGNRFLSERWTSGTGTVITDMRKLFFIFCFFLSPLLIPAQESAPAADEVIDVESSDSQMFNLSVALKIKDGVTEKVVSEKPVQHLATSGKPVILKITAGDNLKAAVRLTLYQKTEDTLLLLTQSTILMVREGRRQMFSAVKSMPVKIGEKVLFFPLGVLPGTENTGYNCMLEMNISKYQQKPVSQD